MTRTALTIAGADPSGGAGIQSDLRTFNSLGVVGLSVITALTAQNSIGVFGVYPVEADILTAQLVRILADTRPDSIKIGMLGSVKQVEALILVFERRSLPPIVLDPVLASTGGVPLLDAAGRYLLISTLLPYCTLITPNLSEASLLTGLPVTDLQSMQKAGEKLLSLGAKAALIKGGHLDGEPIDILIQRDQPPIPFVGRRIDTPHTHGTGCLLSSAIAAGLAKGQTVHESVENAKALVTEALPFPVIVGNERGYPDASRALRSLSFGQNCSHITRLAKFHGLYVVTDDALQAGRSNAEVAALAMDGGANIIQLRDKSLDDAQIIAEAKKIKLLVHNRGKLFILNDRVDIALASDADGVHLGPDDISPADARRLLGPEKLVGVSIGTVAEANEAAQFASYFGVGAIYGSKTKTDAGAAITPHRITEIKHLFPAIPVVGIGGINRTNIQPVIDSGAESVAVVSAVVAADDISNAAKELSQFFNST